ncbi:MAG: hypothetical protein J5950_04020 [Clostridia bacterium]|nr:hypothetical protein [Clostridia bacterium]
MKSKKDKQDKPSFKERFDYWFDRHTSKGSLGLIRALIIASLVLAVLIALLIIAFGFNDEGETGSVIWNGIATLINAWMPYYDEGSLGYLILMSVIAIAGLLFTSVLIGIITSVIEEKIIELKRGNSRVLEKGHTVVLGFVPGEYSLLSELILAAAGKPACVVVAEDIERENLEDELRENLEIPKNFRLLCRTVDITDPASIEKCSVQTCRSVIVTPSDDLRTIKAVLAVSSLLKEKNVTGVRVNAIVSNSDYRFPPSMAETHNISALQTNNILARMIAHSCTQAGLSETFTEVFNFEGSEFYLIDLPGFDGRTFGELAVRLNCAIPAGICRNGKITLNPEPELVLQEGDRILIFSDVSEDARIEAAAPGEGDPTGAEKYEKFAEDNTEAVIFGINDMLPTIIRELPANVSRVFVVSALISDDDEALLRAAAAERNLQVEFVKEDPSDEDVLLKYARMTEHILILNDHGIDADEADLKTTFTLLNLRDVRERYGLRFNITIEMRKELSQKIVGDGEKTDFLVDTSMSSLILAQAAENPELIDVFREILSNTGNELYLKRAGAMKLAGSRSVRELRRELLRRGYVYLGRSDPENGSTFDKMLDEIVTLGEEDNLIVLGAE